VLVQVPVGLFFLPVPFGAGLVPSGVRLALHRCDESAFKGVLGLVLLVLVVGSFRELRGALVVLGTGAVEGRALQFLGVQMLLCLEDRAGTVGLGVVSFGGPVGNFLEGVFVY